MSIPLYSSDFALLDFINDKRALRLENAGLAKLVRHKGHLNRVVLYRRAGDPHPTTVRQYMGTGYSFEHPTAEIAALWRDCGRSANPGGDWFHTAGNFGPGGAERCSQGSAAQMSAGETRVESEMAFDLQPILKGELLLLRPLRKEDFQDLYAVASDPLIWEQHPAQDRHRDTVFQEFFREAMESGGALLAMDTKDGRVVGSSRFHGYDEAHSEIEIGWTFLARSHWGGLYNGEMKRLMLEHAFRFVKSVIFLVGARNFRSQRAVEKIGGVRVASRSDASGRESFVYRITAPTFKP